MNNASDEFLQNSFIFTLPYNGPKVLHIPLLVTRKWIFIYFPLQDSSRLFKNHGTFCLLSVKWTVFISCLQGRLGKCMISKTPFIWLGWKGWYNYNYSGASSYTALTWVLSNSWWRAGTSVEQDVKNTIQTCAERSLITSASVKYVSWHVAFCLLLESTILPSFPFRPPYNRS